MPAGYYNPFYAHGVYYYCQMALTPGASTCSVLVSTIAGRNAAGNADGTYTSATFNNAYMMDIDSSSNIYVADRNYHSIRKITPRGVTNRIVGTGTCGQNSVDGVGTVANMCYPYAVAVAPSGTYLYFTDTYNSKIRGYDMSTNLVTTIAGSSAGSAGFADGIGTNARFYYPYGIAVDTNGNVFVGDYYNYRVRKLDPLTKTVSTFAGSGAAGYLDGTGTTATFSGAWGITVDKIGGNIYLTDPPRIRKITPTGAVTTFAGSSGGIMDGFGTSTYFSNPYGIAADTLGNVFIADYSNSRVRKINSLGFVSTLAGSSAGYTDGVGSVALLYYPYGIAVDTSSNVYISDYYAIRKITMAGNCLAGLFVRNGTCAVVPIAMYNPVANNSVYYPCAYSVLTGAANCGVGGGNCPVGTYYSSGSCLTVPAGFYNPFIGSGVYYYCAYSSLSVAGAANCQSGTNTSCPYGTYYTGGVCTSVPIGYFSPPGGTGILYYCPYAIVTGAWYCGLTVSTVSGTGSGGNVDGGGTAAYFYNPRGIVYDAFNYNFYVVDYTSCYVRGMTSFGTVWNLAGSGSCTYSDGSGKGAGFINPMGIAMNTAETFYVTDNHRIRMVKSTGRVTTIAGSGTAGYADGIGTSVKFSFNAYSDLTCDSLGNVYVADSSNHVIRFINSIGVVSTFAGRASTAGSSDGAGTWAKFNYPYGVAIDTTGSYMYVADGSNHRIRRISMSTKNVTTYAGYSQAYADGMTTLASFNTPIAVKIDSFGSLYVVDSSYRLRKISTSGLVTSIAGSGSSSRKDGTASAAGLYLQSVTADNIGNIYGTDGGHYVRRMSVYGKPCSSRLWLQLRVQYLLFTSPFLLTIVQDQGL